MYERLSHFLMMLFGRVKSGAICSTISVKIEVKTFVRDGLVMISMAGVGQKSPIEARARSSAAEWHL